MVQEDRERELGRESRKNAVVRVGLTTPIRKKGRKGKERKERWSNIAERTEGTYTHTH